MRFSSSRHNRFVFCCALVATGALFAWATTAHAVPASFAQFSEAAPGGNLFALNGSAAETDFGTSTGGPLGAAIPVNFTYLTVTGTLPADLQGVQSAHLSMTSSTTGAASTGFGGLVGAQGFDGTGSLPNSISIIRDTQAAEGSGSQNNLLTVTFNNATLLGIIGSSAPSMSSDTALPGVTITYTSDFLTFPNGEHNFSLTFSSWTGAQGAGGLQIGGVDPALFFLSATAAGAGTFGGNAMVPEPGTISLAVIGLVALVRWARRHR